MKPDDSLLALLARMTRRAHIAEDTSLSALGLSRSFGLSALRAQLEATQGRRLGALTPQMTVAQLRALLAQGNPPPPAGAGVEPPAAASAVKDEQPAAPQAALPLGLGMDIQDWASLPTAPHDLRADPTYAGLFTPAELAGSVLKPDPRRHLCGLFCAKEAAKKAHAMLLNLHPLDLEVRHDDAGRPLLHLGAGAPAAARKLRFLLAITHGSGFSAATCVVF